MNVIEMVTVLSFVLSLVNLALVGVSLAFVGPLTRRQTVANFDLLDKAVADVKREIISLEITFLQILATKRRKNRQDNIKPSTEEKE